MKPANIDKIPPGPELDALVVEEVMGWENVRRHSTRKDGKRDGYVGRKQDKLGRWRLVEVRRYSTDPVESAAIEARMKELGLLQKYLNELGKIANAKGVPAGWARGSFEYRLIFQFRLNCLKIFCVSCCRLGRKDLCGKRQPKSRAPSRLAGIR